MFGDFKKFSLPELEEKVLCFWRINHVFRKAEKKNLARFRTGEASEFIFYEGPPTANGKPGIHHILGRAFKDVVLRYKTMRGFKVRRRAGWDTHGLPVELEVEKKLGLKTKKDIDEYGIAEFNKKCKESVWTYKDEWEKLTERIGFWIDFYDPYITYENSYIESLWNVVKKVDERDLLYKAHKVLPWCSRCGTALSSHELAQGYQTVTDNSVTAKFLISNFEFLNKFKLPKSKTYILSWTTTPWTLPGNVALAVGENIEYALAEKEGDYYIVAKDLAESVLGTEYKIQSTVYGKDLVGLEYEPLFNVEEFAKSDKAYKIYSADFVNTEDGTGVVHTAVMYGEDDYKLGQEVGLPQVHTVGEDGKFTNLAPELAEMYARHKDGGITKKTEEVIFNHLEKNNNLFKIQDYEHEYPFCWRCDTPVLYYARDSWFIAMEKLRDDLVKTNKKINWRPEHIKDGRFGEWLVDAKDWAVSRERYWGTPLPVWECGECEERKVVGSFGELSDLQGGVKNKYILMRHAEAEQNVSGITNSDPRNKDKYGLTDKGLKDVKAATRKLKKEKIDLIFASDFRRAKETAEILEKEIGAKINLDERLREVNTGDFDDQPYGEYHKLFSNNQEKFIKTPPNGENLRDLTARLWSFLEEVEKQHKNKTILIVSHEYPIWMLETVMRGWSEEKSSVYKDDAPDFIETSEFRNVDLLNLPRNEWGIADPHKPFIDGVAFDCECGGEMKRVQEVMDVWFDSGAMPFAQAHYPFDKDKLEFPADYIVEGIDQTRGWFYTLLAVAVLLDKGAPYKNAISLELVLDKHGKKMSKSKGNVVDPMEVTNNFGADSIRWFFYTVNSPGDPKKFDENELKKSLRNFVMVLYNSFKFLNLYVDGSVKHKKTFSPKNILDKWMMSRLHETMRRVEDGLESYNITESARSIGELVDDLSNWFIRRSRERLQRPVAESDFEDAAFTLGFSLLEVSKMAAPFMPFVAEGLYQSLKGVFHGYDFLDSVHLENFPKHNSKFIDKVLMTEMRDVRRLASVALAEREKASIKVRQPLSKLRIKSKELGNNEEFLQILKEEINVKNVVLDEGLSGDVYLDTELTHELKEEGWLREIVRAVQGLRGSTGLEPGELIELGIESGDEIKRVVQKFEDELKRQVGADEVHLRALKNFDAEKETSVDDYSIRVILKKL